MTRLVESNIESTLQEQVRSAKKEKHSLRLRGQGSKDHLGASLEGNLLDISGHSGVISYEPTELVITVRGGTPISEVNRLLSENGQMLPFDPPQYGNKGTIGGAIASGLGGPARPWRGAPRDSVLGVKILTGKGEVLSFGGQVMKNVAGYDVSRLMVGAMGCLGVLLEASIRLQPIPRAEKTLALESGYGEALELLAQMRQTAVPLSGAFWSNGSLFLRLSSSSESGLEKTRSIHGGEWGDDACWQQLRDHQFPFFTDSANLWRLSTAPASIPEFFGEGSHLVDWGGAQHWIFSDKAVVEMQKLAEVHSGHATLFRGEKGSKFHPLPGPVRKLHENLKQVFDPERILNPGRLYDWL